MRTFQDILLRGFDVRVKDERTGEVKEDVIILTKQQLQAAQMVGQSSKELISRTDYREGFTVLDIGKARKVTAELDLEGLYSEAVEEVGG